MPLDGFASFEAYCGPSADIVGAYVQAATGKDDAEFEANLQLYFNQMFTPLLFAAHCSAAHIPFLEGHLDATHVEEQAPAMNQMRDGVFDQVMGLIQLAGASDVDWARRARVLDLLVRDTGNFALALSPQQRLKLVDMARELRAQLPAHSVAKADTIRAAFDRQDCETLCSM